MYDYELNNYLSEHKHLLNQNEYLFICNTCPQLDHIKYNPYGNYFEAWSNVGGYFKFEVHYQEGE